MDGWLDVGFSEGNPDIKTTSVNGLLYDYGWGETTGNGSTLNYYNKFGRQITIERDLARNLKSFKVDGRQTDVIDYIMKTENNNQLRGGSQMSFAIVVNHPGYTLVAADTRSTITTTDKNKETVYNYDDDYHKIAQVPNTNIVVAATGANTFRGNTVTGFISSLKATSVKEVCAEIIETIQPMLYNSDAFSIFHIVGYNNANFVCKTVEVRSQKYMVIDTIPEFNQNYCNRVHSGIKWAMDYTDKIRFTPHKEIDDGIKALREHMVKLFEMRNESIISENGEQISENDKKALGGGIDIVLLEPNKAPIFLERIYPEI
jgi:hypothetical protein